MNNPLEKMGISAEKPARMYLHHPITGEPLKDSSGNQGWIELLSRDSEKARKFFHKKVNDNLRVKSSKKRSSGSDNLSESNEQAAIELIATCTTGWYLVNLDGEVVEFEPTFDNAVELYSFSGTRWLYEAADEFSADRANFT